MENQNSAQALTGSACPKKATELFYVSHPKVPKALLGPEKVAELLVHHYTTERHHLPLILASGELRPSNAGAEHEPPLVWFSKAQRWEGTATKMVMGADGPRLLTFAEQLAEFGCARLSLPADDVRLMSWVDACKYAGITSTTRRKLESVGRRRSASPINWFAIAGAVPLADVRLQRFDGAAWVDLVNAGGLRHD